MMKNLMIRVLFCSLLIFTACQEKNPYDPNQYLSTTEKEKLIDVIVRYASKAPQGVGNSEKFNNDFDEYYREKASQLRLQWLYQKDDDFYFLITQPAPSLTEKRNATGGIINLDKDGRVKYYEEVFRTWKMIPDTLARRGYYLFDKMVKGESLEKYLPASAGDQYAEFPDDRTYFDIATLEWRMKK